MNLIARLMRRNNAKKVRPGEWGENVAEDHLKREKYRILGSRVRLDNRSEIDIVAVDGKVLVFVEVKTRKSEQFGAPVESVKKAKRHALSRSAVRYLRGLRFRPVNIRFDVVEVIGEEGDDDPVVRHIENAFPLDKCYKLPY